MWASLWLMSHLQPPSTAPAISLCPIFLCWQSEHGTVLHEEQMQLPLIQAQREEQSKALQLTHNSTGWGSAFPNQARKNDGKYWTGTGMYFQLCKSPVRDYLTFFYQFSAKLKTEQSIFPLLLLKTEYLLLSGDSKLGHVLAMCLPQKNLFHSSPSAAGVYQAGPWPLVTIPREALWFKFHTHSSLGQHCGGVGTSQSLGLISVLGTPQRDRSWLLWSLSLGHGSGLADREDERKGLKGIIFFVVRVFLFVCGGFFCLWTAGKLSLGSSRAPLQLLQPLPSVTQNQEATMGFLKDREAKCSRQTPQISQRANHNTVGKKKKGQPGTAALLPSCLELHNSSCN